MPPAPLSKSLHELLTLLADGELRDHDAVALEILLQESAQNRAHYRTFLAVHLALQETFLADNASVAQPVAQSRSRPWRWLAAAAAAVVLASLAVWHVGRPPRDPATAGGPAASPSDQPVLAIVASAEGVEWNLPCSADAGVQLPAGSVHLTKGKTVLTLTNGQTLAIQAPASFDLISEREMDFRAGLLGVKQDQGHGLFVVRLPKGAAVCSGSEFSVLTRPDGDSSLQVFSGEVSASTMGSNGRSREEAIVSEGNSVDIREHLGKCQTPPASFVRVPNPLPTNASIADSAYAKVVAADQPIASWRFEETTSDRQVPATHGSQPLDLMESAAIAGPPGRRFLAVDDHHRRGFAYAAAPVATLTREGFTIECLVFSASESHGSAVILESATAPIPSSTSIRHAPQLCAIERMGRMGEHIGHIHPDYALRSVLRYPGGYEGGTNLYSGESHLMHRWHHAVLTFDGNSIRLFLNGEPTDQTAVSFQWETDAVRPIIGRLQPASRDEHRQWIGGIDEVAIYPRPLPPEAIRRHSNALLDR